MNSVTSPMGKRLNRVDGPLKVQGKPMYRREFPLGPAAYVSGPTAPIRQWPYCAYS